MLSRTRNYRLFGRASVVILGLATITLAGRAPSYETDYESYCVPGVDRYGCLSYRKKSDVCFKLCYDYKKKECYAVGRGSVCNESGCKQTYHDICLLPDSKTKMREVNWSSDCYVVERNGCCNATSWGSCCYYKPAPPNGATHNGKTSGKKKHHGSLIERIKAKKRSRA